MAIKIGHASADERYKASGGAAGDQTGREVCTRAWYSSPWDCVLRPKSSEVAEKSAKAVEAACANANIGYDQSARNTLYNYALAAKFDLAAITDKCECDCSSLIHVCVIAGGVPLAYGANGHTTWTLAAALLATGAYYKLTDAKYLNSDAFLKRGDILLNTDAHVAMALENGAQAAEKTPESEAVAKLQPTKGVPVIVWLPLLKKGSAGAAVWTLQELLTAMGYDPHGIDGDFGADTEAALIAYQTDHGLDPDGECGKQTWTSIING